MRRSGISKFTQRVRVIAGLVSLVGMTGALTLSVESWASIPPSAFVIKSMVSKRSLATVKALKFRSVIKFPQDNQSFKALTTVSLVDGKVKTRIFPAQATAFAPKDAIFSYQSTLAQENDGGLNPSFIPKVLFAPDLEGVTQTLIVSGVPVLTEAQLLALPDEAQRQAAEVSTLKRMEKRPQWVFGVSEPLKKGQKPTAEAWFEKDRFLLSKLVHPTQSEKNEFRFENYSFSKEFPFPQRVSVWATDSEQVQMIEELQEFTVLAADAPEAAGGAAKELTEEALSGISSGGLRDSIATFLSTLR